jgi:hypothetical protein
MEYFFYLRIFLDLTKQFTRQNILIYSSIFVQPPRFEWHCRCGKLENTYSVEHLIDLKMPCPKELKQIVIDDLKNITLIEACKI